MLNSFVHVLIAEVDYVRIIALLAALHAHPAGIGFWPEAQTIFVHREQWGSIDWWGQLCADFLQNSHQGFIGLFQFVQYFVRVCHYYYRIDIMNVVYNIYGQKILGTLYAIK